jgi:hypothetical protein
MITLVRFQSLRPHGGYGVVVCTAGCGPVGASSILVTHPDASAARWTCNGFLNRRLQVRVLPEALHRSDSHGDGKASKTLARRFDSFRICNGVIVQSGEHCFRTAETRVRLPLIPQWGCRPTGGHEAGSLGMRVRFPPTPQRAHRPMGRCRLCTPKIGVRVSVGPPVVLTTVRSKKIGIDLRHNNLPL